MGWNSYNSLNRQIRIQDLSKIVDNNKLMIKKLKSANSHYNVKDWENDNKEKNKLVQMLSKNGDRF
jgi:hypothetical protein